MAHCPNAGHGLEYNRVGGAVKLKLFLTSWRSPMQSLPPPAILMVVHQPTSDPGLVGQRLRQRGFSLDIRCPAAGDALPQNLGAYDGLVVFGGPMSANDDRTLPYIAEELRWIERVALPEAIPYLGICLGAQLLARVLGGTVAPHPQDLREIGYYPLWATPEGRGFLPEELWVYHWHGEGFSIPPGAAALARGETFPNQAYRYGDRTYGLQFHPEITLDLIHTWTSRGADQLTLPGAHPRDRHLQDHHHHGPTVNRWLEHFLTQWLPLPQLSKDYPESLAS